LRYLRLTYRLPLLLLHVIAGVLAAIALLNPLTRRLFRSAPEGWLIPWWSRWMLRVFGIHVRVAGEPLAGAALHVANHLSWVDIVVLHSVKLMAFVAKDEIRRWPLVGWMASRAGTIYHRRGSPHSLRMVSDTMTRRLETGFAVALFPEGRAGAGETVLTFHGRLFQCALSAGVPVQPVALRYLEDDGSVNTLTPFRRGESFLVNLFRVLSRRRTIAELRFCAPLESKDTGGRRVLARESRQRIVSVLAQAGRNRTSN